MTDALTSWTEGFCTTLGSVSHPSDEAIAAFALFTALQYTRGIHLKWRGKKEKLMANLPSGCYC